MEIFALTGILKVFNNVIDDIYDYTKNILKKEINKEIIMGKIPNLVEKELQNIRFIKTLWQVDRSVDIDDFYCDSHLIAPTKNGKKEKRRLVKGISDFKSKNIVIKGIAGQGKSIFLRYLCIREFESGNKIPIFIELRRIQQGETLLNHISRFFETLDLSIDHDLFKIIAKSGNFIFFLDAFDEIDSNINQKILNEIEQLASTSPNCRMIITTRPNSSIVMSPLFNVWTLDDLRGSEYKNVIIKLADSPENAESTIQKIEAHKSSVSELLCTPLLVTLLLISYKSYQKIPEQLSDFYESIFYVLLQRHDGTKPGFVRHRRCSLNDNQYREVFNALCYETKKTRKSSFNNELIYRLVNDSMVISNIEEDAENYLKDIVGVTCLILFEGDEYRFIHRSVQEYYAAMFIKNRPENAVIKFYNACLIERNWRDWESEITFLSEIDKFKYSKFFLIPLCRKWLVVDSDSELINGCPPVTNQRIKKILEEIGISIRYITGQEISEFRLKSIIDLINFHHIMFHYVISCDYQTIIPIIEKKELYTKESSALIDKKIRFFSLLQIFEANLLVDEISRFTGEILNQHYKLWKSAYEYTTKQESFDIIEDLLSE